MGASSNRYVVVAWSDVLDIAARVIWLKEHPDKPVRLVANAVGLCGERDITADIPFIRLYGESLDVKIVFDAWSPLCLRRWWRPRERDFYAARRQLSTHGMHTRDLS